MELLLDNPFRVLGLPATATARDIAKRVSDLEVFAELGKQKRYETDLPQVGAVARTVDAVKTAARKIEHAESKLFHSFFWFRAGHEVDERALAALADGRYLDALETWNAELSKTGRRRYSSRLNRTVLRLLLATLDGFDTDAFAGALQDIGFVIDDDLDDSVKDVLGAAAAGLNRESLWKRIIDALVKEAQHAPGSPFGTNAIGILQHCWSFPPDSLDYITSKVANPLIERIEAAVATSEHLRQSLTRANSLSLCGGLESAQGLVLELRNALGEENTRFQAIANRFAEELCDCAIAAHNKLDDTQLSSMLIDWATRVPSFGRVTSRIAENKETIDAAVKHQEHEALFNPLAEQLKVELRTLDQAESQLDTLKRLLAKLRARVGRGDEHYMAASSACVHHILNFLVETVNKSQGTPSTSRELGTLLCSTIDQATELTRNLLKVDMDGDARSRVQTNLDTIEGIQRNLHAVRAAVQAREDRSFVERVPGWLWVVGVIFLLAMCSK